MIEAGPAAGVLAAARLGKETGLDKVLSFDMGGTTAKACLIEDVLPAEKAAGEIGGLAEAVTPAGELRSLPCHLGAQGGMDGFYAARLIRDE